MLRSPHTRLRQQGERVAQGIPSPLSSAVAKAAVEDCRPVRWEVCTSASSTSARILAGFSSSARCASRTGPSTGEDHGSPRPTSVRGTAIPFPAHRAPGNSANSEPGLSPARRTAPLSRSRRLSLRHTGLRQSTLVRHLRSTLDTPRQTSSWLRLRLVRLVCRWRGFVVFLRLLKFFA